MGVLDQFTPGQRQAVMYGLPVVAVFAFVASRKKAATATAATPQSSAVTLPSQQVLGAGQLAEFEQSLTDSYNHLAGTVTDALLNAPAPPAPSVPTPSGPTDAPVPVNPPAPLPAPAPAPAGSPAAATSQFVTLAEIQGGAPQLNGGAILPSGTGPHAAMAGEYPVIYG